MDEPMVTICIPNYNKAKYIEETIVSVFDQTYRNIEIIVVEDCSTDDSLSIIQSLKLKSPFPYTICRNIGNKGVSYSSSLGATKAKGKYFQILSSDDIILPDKIKMQVSLLEKDDKLAGVYGNVSIIDEESCPIQINYFSDIGWNKPLPSGNIFSSLLEMNFVPAPTILFRTKYILAAGNYDINLRLEDWDMLLSLSERNSIYYCNHIFAHYRMEQNSLMHSVKTKPLMIDAICRTLQKRLGISSELDAVIYNSINNHAAILYSLGGKTSKYWLLQGLRNKWKWKNAIYFVASLCGIKYAAYKKSST